MKSFVGKLVEAAKSFGGAKGSQFEEIVKKLSSAAMKGT